MRVNRAVALLILVVTVLAGFAVMLSSVLAGSSGRSQSKLRVIAPTPPSQPNQAHLLYASLWRTDGSLVSTISIKNILVVAPIQVTPTLFMSDGTAYLLPTVTVPTSGVTTINVNDALAAAPQSVAPHVSQFGSATLLYSYPSPGHLIASTAAIDVPRSLMFTYPVIEPMPMAGDNSHQILEGLWWKHDRGVNGIISLSNTADQESIVILRAIQKGGDSDVHEVQLAPHATQLLNLEQISRDASDPRKAAGGIQVEYQGSREAIMVTGSLVNESEGYSANMPFSSHDQTQSPNKKIHAGGAGIMVGKPDAVMMPGFPANTRFAPYLALLNTTASSLDVTLGLNYMPDVAGATPVDRNLPTQKLHPFEARAVDLLAMLTASGLKSFQGMINIGTSFTGRAGDLLLASGSVDQTGTYVFPVEPQVIGESIGRISGYWSIANGNDAMFSLWNPTDSSQDLMATLYYGDGSGTYQLPIHLGPQASTTIDVGMLIREKTRDIKGNVIPQNIRDGSASFDTTDKDSTAPDGRKRVTVVLAGSVFNVANATCGGQWQYCNGYSNFYLSPGSAQIAVGGSQGFTAWGRDSYGNPNEFFGGQWSSEDLGTITAVDNAGNATGVSPGSGGVVVELFGVNVFQGEFCVSDNMNDACPTSNVFVSAPVTVNPTGFTITVTSTPVQGETNSMISGQSAQVRVTVLGASGSTANYYTGSVHFSSADTSATLPSDYVYTGSDAGNHTFNVTLKSVSGNSSARDLSVKDNGSAVSSTQNIYVWFQVIATREGLVGHTTACSHVIVQNDHFVALPATGLCNVGVRLRNGANLQTTNVLDVGPWCPNTPGPGNSNTCSCPSDRYWQTSGVPFAATASCATSHAGIDLADGTFSALGLTNNGNIYWRFQ